MTRRTCVGCRSKTHPPCDDGHCHCDNPHQCGWHREPTTELRCRICGTGLRTGIPHVPDPLLPGDLPTRDQLCAACRRDTASVERCRCGADVVIVNYRYGLHFDDNQAIQLCALSHTLTPEGWRELLSDILDDAGLSITYRRWPMLSDHDHGPATAKFLHVFFEQWTKLLANEIEKFEFDPQHWIDLLTDQPAAIEPARPVSAAPAAPVIPMVAPAGRRQRRRLRHRRHLGAYGI
jgi:hypothetical protein